MFRRFKNFDKLFEEIDSMFENLPLNMENKFSPLKGDCKVEEGSDEFGKWSKHTYTSKDGSMLISSFVRTSNTSGGDELFDLKQELTNAVETENFEKAIEIRDQIKKLENNQETINNLKQKMDECIKNQDFETAIKYRDEINKLR
jgi:excinuclease UvrABC helicase subunit UvrB